MPLRALLACAVLAAILGVLPSAVAQEAVDFLPGAPFDGGAALERPARQESALPGGAVEMADDRLPVPRMLGDQVRRARAITFTYETVESAPNVVPGVAGGVFTNLRNTKVATNNGALPTDRFAYDYSFFKNAVVVRGVSQQTVPSGLQPFLPQQKHLSQDVAYDVNLHTFAYEKTFCDGAFSLEARVPFADTLRSRLDLSAGKIVGNQFDPVDGIYYLALNSTPQNTWGNDGWELQDVSVIFKAMLYQSECRDLCFSGGLQVVAPSANGTHLRTTDYWSPFNEFGALWPKFNALARRTQTLDISNSIWTLSPFLAMSAAPTQRSFLNGFLQLDVPVGQNTVKFSQQYESQFDESAGLTFIVQPITSVNGGAVPPDFAGTIRDQVLMQVDLGGGYWVYQNPGARWLRGVATILELHLMQTLEPAEVLQLPHVSFFNFTSVTPGGPPTVSSTASSATLTDLTFGIDTQLGTACSLAVGGSVPLGPRRTYDSEVLVRLNYCF